MNLKTSCSTIILSAFACAIIFKPAFSSSFIHSIEEFGEAIFDGTKHLIGDKIHAIADIPESIIHGHPLQVAKDILEIGNPFIPSIIGGLPSKHRDDPILPSNDPQKPNHHNIVEHIPDIIVKGACSEEVISYARPPIITPILGFNKKSHGVMTTHINHQEFYDTNIPDKSYQVIKLSHSLLINPLKREYQAEKEDNNNYYLFTIKYMPSDGKIGVTKDVNLIEYSPKTTGVTTSFWGGAHTSASSNVNASIGLSEVGPNASIGGGVGIDCGINSTLTCDFPPIQILTRTSSHTVHWLFKIFGSEEPKTTFRVGLTSQWKLNSSSNLYDNLLNKLPFVVATANGRFNMHVDQESAAKLMDKSTSGTADGIMNLFTSYTPLGMIGKNLYDTLVDSHNDKSDSSKPKIPSLEMEYSAPIYYQAIKYSLPLPLRSDAFTLKPEFSSIKLEENSSFPTVVQKNALAYMLYNNNGSLKFMYSDDAVYWQNSKILMQLDNVLFHSNLVHFNNNLYVSTVDKKDNQLNLYGLYGFDEGNNWVKLKIPNEIEKEMKSVSEPALTVFKDKIFLTYVNEDGHKINNIVYANKDRVFGPHTAVNSTGKLQILDAISSNNFLYLGYRKTDLNESRSRSIFKSNNGMTNWQSLGNYSEGNSNLRLSSQNDKLFMFQAGVNNLWIDQYKNNESHKIAVTNVTPDSFPFESNIFSLIDLKGGEFGFTRKYIGYSQKENGDNYFKIGYLISETDNQHEDI